MLAKIEIKIEMLRSSNSIGMTPLIHHISLPILSYPSVTIQLAFSPSTTFPCFLNFYPIRLIPSPI